MADASCGREDCRNAAEPSALSPSRELPFTLKHGGAFVSKWAGAGDPALLNIHMRRIALVENAFHVIIKTYTTRTRGRVVYPWATAGSTYGTLNVVRIWYIC